MKLGDLLFNNAHNLYPYINLKSGELLLFQGANDYYNNCQIYSENDTFWIRGYL